MVNSEGISKDFAVSAQDAEAPTRRQFPFFFSLFLRRLKALRGLDADANKRWPEAQAMQRIGGSR